MSALLSTSTRLQLDKICRACLLEHSEVQPLFSDGLEKKLIYVAGVDVSESDGLPNLMCLQCVQQCESAFRFKHICENSNNILRRNKFPEFKDQLLASVEEAKTALANEFHFSENIESVDNKVTKEAIDNGVFLDSDYKSNVKVEVKEELDEIKQEEIEIIDFMKKEDEEENVSDKGESQLEVNDEDIDNDDAGIVEYIQHEEDKVNFKNQLQVNLTRLAIIKRTNGTGDFGNPEGGEESIEMPKAEIIDIKEEEEEKVTPSLTNELKEKSSCEKSYKGAIAFSNHKRSHKRSHKEEILECQYCGKKFRTSDLKRHVRTHTGEKPYKCDICHKTFRRKDTLKQHISLHTGEKPYECNICHKTFTQSHQLTVHSRSHTGKKSYECNICHKIFLFSSTLTKHIRSHTREKPYECGVCHKTYKQKTHLKEHIRCHTGEKPYECNICHKTFARDNDLKRHRLLHTGEKPYECHTCHKTFTQKSNLKAHIQIHTGEKPYQCNICHKTFGQKYNLKIHRRSHTGEKPYECNVCHKTFAVNLSLRKHLNTHDGCF